jgi:hypothetical protein
VYRESVRSVNSIQVARGAFRFGLRGGRIRAAATHRRRRRARAATSLHVRRSPREMVVVGVAEDAESVGMCPERLAQVRTLCRGYVDRGEKAFTQVRLERRPA